MTRAGVSGLDEVDVVMDFVVRLPLLLEPILWTVVVLGFPPLPLFIVWLDMVVVVVVARAEDVVD